MPEVRNGDVTLHVEVDGAGEPVTILAHGLTNSCRELAPFTPSLKTVTDFFDKHLRRVGAAAK